MLFVTLILLLLFIFHLIVVIAWLCIVFVMSSSHYLLNSKEGGKHTHTDTRSDAQQFIAFIYAVTLLFEMIFILLLTETRDHQRRRKYEYNFQLSLINCRCMNDYSRENIPARWTISKIISINRYEILSFKTSLTSPISHLPVIWSN